MKYTYSPQKGKPGHCMLAQVWDEHGSNAIANIASTKLQKDATQTAKLFSRSHEMLTHLKWFINGINDGSLIVFTDDDQPKAVHDDDQDKINKIELLVKEIKS